VTFVYSGFLFVLCAGLYYMATYLDRRYHWTIILGMLFFYVAGYASLSLPAADAMLTTDDPVWIYLGCTASIVFSLLLIHILAKVFCVDSSSAMANTQVGKSPDHA